MGTKGVTMKSPISDVDENHKQGRSRMNRCEWYLRRRTQWPLKNEEKVQVMDASY